MIEEQVSIVWNDKVVYLPVGLMRKIVDLENRLESAMDIIRGIQGGESVQRYPEFWEDELVERE